jgi:hypothetical protein
VPFLGFPRAGRIDLQKNLRRRPEVLALGAGA